jgi:hypothetical protein
LLGVPVEQKEARKSAAAERNVVGLPLRLAHGSESLGKKKVCPGGRGKCGKALEGGLM